MKNYYEEKIDEIKKTIKINKLKAIQLINEELKMPYIPEKYEKKFIKFHEDLNISSKPKERNFNREEIINMLFSGKETEEGMAIDLLQNQNIRFFLNDVEKWLYVNKEKNLLKAVLYEILVDQEIDKEINFGDIKINPKKNGSIIINELNRKVLDHISNSDFEPQIQEASIESFQFYLLKTFPKKLDNNKNFANNLMNVIKKMLNGQNNFVEEEIYIYEILKQK